MKRIPYAVGLLICTLMSENLGLEKSRFVSNLIKISGPGNLDYFFLGLPLEKSQFCFINLKKIHLRNWKKPRFAGPDIFLWFEADLDFSRP